MTLRSSELLRRISTEFSLSYVEQDWGIENASNTSISKAFLVLDAYLGQDIYVDRQIIDLLFESANESLLKGALRPEEEERLRLLIASNEFKTEYTGAFMYWSELNHGEFPIANIIRPRQG